MDYLLDVVIFSPLVGAVVLGFIPRERVEWLRLGALAITTVTFVLALGVLFNFESGEAGFQLGSELDWIPEWGVGYTTGIDGISLWLVLLTAFLMPLGVLASW